MPLYFIPNRGQLDDQVAYHVQGMDKSLYFTQQGITMTLARPSELKGDSGTLDTRRLIPRIGKAPQNEGENGSDRWVVKLEFIGANSGVKPEGEEETGAIVSYFKGRQEDWKAGIPTYSKIAYRNLWPGIDLVYYGTVNRLKYEFVVHPGADPSRIRLAYRGAESISVDGEGRLKVSTPIGGFADDVPVAYQEMGGRRQEIKLAYKMDRLTKLDAAGGSLK